MSQASTSIPKAECMSAACPWYDVVHYDCEYANKPTTSMPPLSVKVVNKIDNDDIS